jgi:hypothetical protein
VNSVVDHVPGDDQPQIRDVQHAIVVGVGVADLDHHQVVVLEGEPVVRDGHRGDRRWRDPLVELVPQQRPRRHVAVHLGDGTGGGDDTGSEPFGQQPGGVPVIAVAVGDEDVRHVSALASDPVAEYACLIFGHPGVGEHGVLAAVDQRAGHGREPLRLPVREKTVLWRRVVDEHVVGEVPGLVHDWACLDW